MKIEKYKKLFLLMVFIILGFSFLPVSMLSGGILKANLNDRDLFIAILIGNLVLCIYTGLLAYMAGDTGLSTRVLARYSFGERGSSLVSFLLGVTQIAWFGIGIVMVGSNLAGTPVDIAPVESMEMGMAIAVCIGSFISFGTLVPDLARFAKNRTMALIITVIALFIGSFLMLKLGVVGALIITGLSIWVIRKYMHLFPESKLVIVKGIIGIFIGIILYNNFMTWLALLNIVMPSVGGVMIADYFVIRKGTYLPVKNMMFTSVGKPAVLAWISGLLGACLLPGIPPINSFAIALIAYVSFTKIAKMMRTEIGMQNSL